MRELTLPFSNTLSCCRVYTLPPNRRGNTPVVLGILCKRFPGSDTRAAGNVTKSGDQGCPSSRNLDKACIYSLIYSSFFFFERKEKERESRIYSFRNNEAPLATISSDVDNLPIMRVPSREQAADKGTAESMVSSVFHASHHLLFSCGSPPRPHGLHHQKRVLPATIILLSSTAAGHSGLPLLEDLGSSDPLDI